MNLSDKYRRQLLNRLTYAEVGLTNLLGEIGQDEPERALVIEGRLLGLEMARAYIDEVLPNPELEVLPE